MEAGPLIEEVSTTTEGPSSGPFALEEPMLVELAPEQTEFNAANEAGEGASVGLPSNPSWMRPTLCDN